jgi:hypothetical protein
MDDMEILLLTVLISQILEWQVMTCLVTIFIHISHVRFRAISQHESMQENDGVTKTIWVLNIFD